MPPVGVACYRPVGTPVTITSAAVSSVTAYRNQPGPATYGFVVAFPTADVAALTAVIRQAQDSGDATSISVAGKLWQDPQPRDSERTPGDPDHPAAAGTKPSSFTTCWSRPVDRGWAARGQEWMILVWWQKCTRSGASRWIRPSDDRQLTGSLAWPGTRSLSGGPAYWCGV